MNLYLNRILAKNYSSSSQIIRVLTEDWVKINGYCPNCGLTALNKYANNKPVADFFCSGCSEDYELKSKRESVVVKIVDGAYRTMIERLNSNKNPNFFLLTYDPIGLEVLNFFVIPKHFFIPEIIEKRRPLTESARRAGWIGCNILLQGIPKTGKIFFVRNRKVEPNEKVLSEWRKTLFLREEKETEARGWLLDIMNCIDSLRTKTFSLSDVYEFERNLSIKHPKNHHIKDKIRQQLQILRDKGYLDFTERGHYHLT